MLNARSYLPAFLATLLTLCLSGGAMAQVIATAEIQAHYEFVLGDYATQDYSAKLTNRGDVPVVIRGLSKASGKVTRTMSLAAKGRLRLDIKQDETVILVNDSDEYVKVSARLSYGVEGMSSRPVTTTEYWGATDFCLSAN